MKQSKNKNFITENWLFFIIIIFIFIPLILNLGKQLFNDWDECLYSVYPLEMKKTGNFLINQWNSYLDMQKPPLYAWILQIPFFFAKNEFFPRLFSVFAGILLLTAVYFFSKKYFSKRIGIISIFLLLIIDNFVIYSQKLNTDIFYSLFIFLGFWFWIESERSNRKIFYSSLMFALAVMIKGLSIVSFLFALFILIFTNPSKKIFLNFFLLMFFIFILIFPWHLAAYLKYGYNFVKIYFLENIIQRSRFPIEFHFGGRLYYFKLIWQQLSYWLLGLIIFPIYILFSLNKIKNQKDLALQIKKNHLILEIFLMFFIPFIFLIQIKTKISWYLMPVYPFLCLFLAISFDYFLKKGGLLIKLIFFLYLIINAFHSLKVHSYFGEKKFVISDRNQVALVAKKTSHKTLEYLVSKSERVAKALLDQSPNLKISSTFIYGGNPCAVYYSEKKVNYYYSTEEFIKNLLPGKLYLIENNDLSIVKYKPVKIIYQNKEFTLFEILKYNSIIKE